MNVEWKCVCADYLNSCPQSYAVVDNFLPTDIYNSIRDFLILDGGWRQKNWQVDQLFCKEPPIPHLLDLISTIKLGLGNIADGLELVKHWGVLCHTNNGLQVHSDNAAIAINLWLTPDEYNISPETGGMVIYDLKRTEDMAIHEFNAMPWAGDFLSNHPNVSSVNIPYRNNRAVIFDARLFHESDNVKFSGDMFEHCRMGLTLALDNPDVYSERMKKYKVGTKS